MLKKIGLATALVFSAAQPTAAHNFVEDDSNWCPISTVEIGEVDMNALQLKGNVSEGILCSIPLARINQFVEGSENWDIIEYIQPAFYQYVDEDGHMHGEIDDPDFWADDYRVSVAYAMCACSSLNGDSYIDPSKVRPRLITDDAASAQHHNVYTLDSGMNFACQVCPRLGVTRSSGLNQEPSGR